MAPTVEKKISELEMGLLHLQQNIDIPEINLPIHPVVSAVIKKCSEEGRKPKVEDFGDKVEDAQFLNALQSGVNRWIREIQKVNIWTYFHSYNLCKIPHLQNVHISYISRWLKIEIVAVSICHIFVVKIFIVQHWN